MDEALEYLAGRPEFSEVARVTTYRFWGPGGQIEAQINDFGEAQGDARFSAYAQYADTQGRPELVGNTYGATAGAPAPTVTAALEDLSWNVFVELDPD